MTGNLAAGRAQGTTDYRRRTTAVTETSPRPSPRPARGPALRRSRTRLNGALHVVVALLSLAWAGPALALGLGQATVRSYFQQPLDARIDLISRSEAEMATVTAGLASPADFQVMGLQRGAIATPLEFTISRDLADPHIRVTSKLPMNEPVVQLVVEVVWASGRMLRQYTLFLDPPTFAAPAPLPATPPAAVQRDVPLAGESAPQRTEPEIAAVDTPAAQTSPFTEGTPGALPPPAASSPPVPTREREMPAVDDDPADPLVQSAPSTPAVTSAPVVESDPVDPVPAAGPPFDPPATPPAEPVAAPVADPIAETVADPVSDSAADALDATGEPAATLADVTPTEADDGPAGTPEASVDSLDSDPALTDSIAEPAAEAQEEAAERLATVGEVASAEAAPVIDTAADAEATLDRMSEPGAPEAADPGERAGRAIDEGTDPVPEANATEALDDTLIALPAEDEPLETPALAADETDALTPEDLPTPVAAVEDDATVADEASQSAEAAGEPAVADSAGPTTPLADDVERIDAIEADAMTDTVMADAADESAEATSAAPDPAEAPTPGSASEATPEPTDALVASTEPTAPPGEAIATESEVVPEPPPVDLVYRAVMPTPGAALPATVDVQRGDTLWSLSQAYAQAEGVSVNQVMLAVQQANPQAFQEGNINRMMAGEVLRMPTRDDMLARNAREAMLEVMRQESLYRTRWDAPSSPDDIPTITNLADAAPSNRGATGEALADADPASVDSRLELVPPDGADAEAQGLGQGGSGETGVSSGESVVEELARTQEELANARQENAYLADRVAELEAELGRDSAPEDGGVADTTLAEMEDRLREERLAGEEAPEIAVRPDEARDSWLLRYGGWVFGVVALLVAALVVFLRRQGDPEYRPRSPQAGLGGSGEPTLASDSDAAEDASKPTPTNAPEAAAPSDVPKVDEGPETVEDRLNLARAYVAMGKRRKARDQLEAVIAEGEPAQVREAREMLSEL